MTEYKSTPARLKWQRENREKCIEYNRRYARKHPEKFALTKRIQVYRRRARLYGAEGTHTAQNIRDLLAVQPGCAYCGADIKTDYHIDHIIPISRGGGNGMDNITLSCPACNRAKGNKTLEEWAA